MKICFIGDVYMTNNVLENIDKDVFWTDLHDSDLVILNFEAPVTEASTARENKKYNLSVSEQAVAFFKNKPVVLNLANNHVMDFGDKRDIAFVLRPNQPALMAAMNRYVGKNYRGVFFNVTYNKYF